MISLEADPRNLDLEGKVGQLLAVGFPGGPGGLSVLEKVLRRTRAGNLILFSRNAPGGPEELRDLLAEARRLVMEATGGLPPLVAVDQEGGLVARVTRGLTPIPGAMAQAAAYAAGLASLEELRELGRICGRELLALGINWNLAPVADVNSEPANPVIGPRSYGEDPEAVAELASAFAAGLADSGILATAKHFPGHGDTRVDSHLGLPLVPHSLERLEAVELRPFRRLVEEGIAAVMTAHVRFPALEPEPIPATLSRRVVEGLLRGRLGFRGLAASDCLEMGAIAGRYEDAAARAVAAGIDLVFVSHGAEAQEAACASILRAVRSGSLPEARIDEAVSRIAAAKARLPPPLAWEEARYLLSRPESLALAARISRASLSLLRPGPGLPPGPGSLYLDLGPAASTGAEEGTGPASVAAALAARGSALRALRLGPDPAPPEIEAALGAAAAAMAEPGAGLALGLYAPSSHPGQLELLRRGAALAASRGRPLGLVSMRGPYEAPFLAAIAAEAGGPEPAQLCAYEYTALSAESVADFLTGSARAEGRPPFGAHPRPAIS